MTGAARKYPLVVVLGALALAAALPVAAEAAPPLNVVQIGDSYSAGNGAGNYYGPKDCFRSSSNWAERYLDTLQHDVRREVRQPRVLRRGHQQSDQRPRDGRRSSRTCSCPGSRRKGRSRRAPQRSTSVATARRTIATTRPIPSRPSTRSPSPAAPTVIFECARTMEPQIDAVGAETDVVLLTIGGNDVHFSDIVKQCFVVGARDPGSCRDKVDGRPGRHRRRRAAHRRGPADTEGTDAAGRAHRPGRLPVPREERRLRVARRLPVPRYLRGRARGPQVRRPRRPRRSARRWPR